MKNNKNNKTETLAAIAGGILIALVATGLSTAKFHVFSARVFLKYPDFQGSFFW